ncbi:MAG TPA: hypothetical protein VFT95_07145 [Micromonosporaceae bacterium]|nr:hypothetical protein [Micromonosporaceae bacterium]
MDDRFDEHPKVIAILDHEDPFAAAMAIGTWAVCFSWAHRNTRKRGQTPGLVPAGLPKRYFGRDVRVGIDLLVKHGLWDPHESGGWTFHDFQDYLPKEETRDARSEAGKRGAAKRWAGHQKADASDADQNGNLPSGDNNEPSGHGKAMASGSQTDGNAVASDGSRAPTRRAIPKGIAPTPTPTPVPPSAGAAAPPPEQGAFDGMPDPEPEIGAGDVVAAFCDGAREAGLDVPSGTLRGRVGRAAKTLIGEGKRSSILLAAAFEMGGSGHNDLDVAYRRAEIAARNQAEEEAARQRGTDVQKWVGNRPRSPTNNDNGRRPSTATQRMEQALDIAAELDAQYGTGGTQ